MKKCGIELEPHLKETIARIEKEQRKANGDKEDPIHCAGLPLTFDEDGNLNTNWEYKCGKEGIEISAFVEVKDSIPQTKNRREVKKGERGTVTALDQKGVSVRFNETEGDVRIPRTALKNCSTPHPEENKNKKPKKDHQSECEAEETSPQNTPLKTIAWGARSEDATSEYIKGHIRGLLLH